MFILTIKLTVYTIKFSLSRNSANRLRAIRILTGRSWLSIDFLAGVVAVSPPTLTTRDAVPSSNFNSQFLLPVSFSRNQSLPLLKKQSSVQSFQSLSVISIKVQSSHYLSARSINHLQFSVTINLFSERSVITSSLLFL
jgi:hypothetical protein